MLGDGSRCYKDNSFSSYWSDATTGNISDTIIIIMRRKEKPTGRWHARNTHLRKQVALSRIFKRMVPVDYSYQSKKKYPGTFSFTCPVTALPVSYRRRLTLCTALSTSPPGHPGLPATTCIYVVGLLPVELNFLFLPLLCCCCCPPKINGSNSKWSLLWLHNLEKMEKN